MPQRCTICTHRRRKVINAALLRLEAYRDIAARFGVSKDSLARHYHNHLVSEDEPETNSDETGTATSLTADKQRENSVPAQTPFGKFAPGKDQHRIPRIPQNETRAVQAGEPLDLKVVALQILAE